MSDNDSFWMRYDLLKMRRELRMLREEVRRLSAPPEPPPLPLEPYGSEAEDTLTEVQESWLL